MDEQGKLEHKCYGCLWGKDVGTHFFCPWQECKKDRTDGQELGGSTISFKGMEDSKT